MMSEKQRRAVENGDRGTLQIFLDISLLGEHRSKILKTWMENFKTE